MPVITNTNSLSAIVKNADKWRIHDMAKKANQWFTKEIAEIRKNRFNKFAFIGTGGAQTVKRLEIGKMYFFEYVPKYSGIGNLVPESQYLKVYDRYPLVLPFSVVPNGFLGINLHYLPIKVRAILLDRLLGTANLLENRLRVNWQILNSISRVDVGSWATHHYLLNHITSKFRLVKIDDYPKAIMLPIAGWYGTNRALVNRFKAVNTVGWGGM